MPLVKRKGTHKVAHTHAKKCGCQKKFTPNPAFDEFTPNPNFVELKRKGGKKK